MDETNKVLLVSRCAWTLFNFRAGLMRELVGLGHDVIGGGAGDDGFKESVEELGVPFHHLPVDRRGLNPVQDVRLLATLFFWYRREKPDVVHHFTIKPVIYGSIAAKMAKVPRIVNTVTGLGYVFIEEKAVVLRKVVERLYRFALKQADITFFQNREDHQLFLERRLIGVDKAQVLPGSGVNCRYFNLAASDNRIKNGPGETFLMVARLLRDKGLYEYAEAAKIIKERFPGCRCQLLGRRDTRNPNVVSQADIDTWTSSGLLQWLGEVDDVREIVAQSDVVVLPSYREGTPRSLLEAAAMGKPIITTDTAGCRDVVDDGINGLLVTVKDSQALAAAMIELIENPERAVRMGREGRQKVEREFDERIVIQRTLSAYNPLSN